MQKRTDFFDNSLLSIVPDIPLVTRNKPHNNQLCTDLYRFISAYPVVSHFLRFAWQTTDEQVKIDLSNVDLDISGVDENGEEWSSEKFFEKLKERYQEDFPTLNGYAIFVLKDGKYTQVAYSAELDITKYKEITDEDYTDKYCIGDAVVAKWDY